MKHRKPFIIVLTALLPLWGLGIANHHAREVEIPTVKSISPPKTGATKQPGLSLNPKVSRTPANLNQGYLFNRERFLKSAGSNLDSSNQRNINMDSLQYNGSIIQGDIRKALISYTEGTAKTVKRVNTRTNKTKRATSPQTISLIITLGETIGGYTVSEVEPLQVTFTRGSHTITKDLFSADKQRKQPARVQKNKKKQATKKPARTAAPRPPRNEPIPRRVSKR